MDKVQITVIGNHQDVVIDCAAKETILEAMLRQGITIRADCGGRGTCGKCELKVLSGTLIETNFDRKVFTEEELREGYRLACKAVPTENVTVLLADNREVMLKGITDSRINPTGLSKCYRFSEGYVIGIDLGTTTLAFQLADFKGTSIAIHSEVNPQRSYGADVLSRMKASNEGKKDQLRLLIGEALIKGIDLLIRKADITANELKQIVIAGNTTMIHLLMGYSCESLGIFPFTPVNMNAININYQELFLWNRNNAMSEVLSKTLQEVPVHIYPGISTFVGGDILAGLAVCGYDTLEKPSLLIDFGTNGEIALGSREFILVTSTAAGPAFEGGNISCGVGSVPGAISHINLQEDSVVLETIEGMPPIGLCGTGVIDLAAELYRNGKMDNTGLLIDEYFQEGYPIFSNKEVNLCVTQKDIRELQLAKAAVRAGIELLLLRCGITYEQLDRVFLAGGFGFFMDAEKAARIGLLPAELQEKISIIGNSALAGALQYAVDSRFADKITRIKEISREVHLSAEEEFNDLYLEYMAF